MSKDIYDLTIIGAGPIGLYAGVYAGMRKAKVKIIESLPNVGGQLSALYPEKYIYDLPGFPKVLAKDFIDNLEKQLHLFSSTICLNEKVEAFDWLEEEKLFCIHTNAGIHYSGAIVLTVGKGSFAPRMLNMEHEETYAGKNIHYHITDLEFFRNKEVAIAGGGDSAIDWALLLEMIAKKVHIIHRRKQFRAHEHSVSRLEESSINIWTPFVVEAIKSSDKFDGLVLKNVKTRELQDLDVEHLLVNYGFTSNIAPIDSWDFTFERGKIIVGRKQETDIPGIFAAGDIAGYGGRADLITTGLGEAPNAVNHALEFVRPDERIATKHSTSLFEEKEGS